jgi:transposase
VLDRHDLNDEQWARLELLLPRNGPRRGRPWADHRRVVDAVLWRTRTGCPWRDLPPSYGPWKTAYNRHRRWSADGTWVRVLADLRAGCDGDAGAGDWIVGVDSTVIRAHHHAAGARRIPPGDVMVPTGLTGGCIE